jgi:hypothetical protein
MLLHYYSLLSGMEAKGWAPWSTFEIYLYERSWNGLDLTKSQSRTKLVVGKDTSESPAVFTLPFDSTFCLSVHANRHREAGSRQGVYIDNNNGTASVKMVARLPEM